MPTVSGPQNEFVMQANNEWVRLPPMESNAITLGEALGEYGALFKVSVVPCAAPLSGQTEVKYFEVRKLTGEIENLVDIHIQRGDLEICPKQDLTFSLLPTDRVQLGLLVC